MYKCKIFYVVKKGSKKILVKRTINSDYISLLNGVYKCFCKDKKIGLGFKNIISIYINNRWCPPVQVSEIL